MIRIDRQHVLVAGADGDIGPGIRLSGAQVLDACRCRVVIKGAVAELAFFVAAPGPGVALTVQGGACGESCADGGDAGQRRDLGGGGMVAVV